MAGIDPESVDPENPPTFEQLEKFKNYTPKMMRESTASHLLNHYYRHENLDKQADPETITSSDTSIVKKKTTQKPSVVKKKKEVVNPYAPSVFQLMRPKPSTNLAANSLADPSSKVFV